MKNKARIRKFSIVLFLAIVISLFGTAAYAQESNPTVEVFRFGNFYVGIKITFPNEISGDFGGVIRGKYFDCVVVPTNTLYCIAPFRVKSDPSLLTIYNKEGGEIILQNVIYSPGEFIGGEEPTPVAPPDEEECIECVPQ
jgi:hypothetical protein